MQCVVTRCLTIPGSPHIASGGRAEGYEGNRSTTARKIREPRADRRRLVSFGECRGEGPFKSVCDVAENYRCHATGENPTPFSDNRAHVGRRDTNIPLSTKAEDLLPPEIAMSSPTMELVIERLESLERERRQLLWGGGSVLSIALVLLATQAHLLTGRGTVEAQKLVLKDSMGHVRASLGMGPDGSPALSLLDERGDLRVRLHGSQDQNAALTFMNNKRVALALTSTAEGAAMLQLFDKNQRSASGFYLWPDGTTGLGLQMGAQSIDLSTKPNGTPGLTISGNETEKLEPVVRPAARAATLTPVRWESPF
jgi:hypothetical protein